MPVAPPFSMKAMYDEQEHSAMELREELQHNAEIIREMSSLPVFGVGKLPPLEELMELREHDMLVVAARGNPAGQEDKCRFTGDEKFFFREKIRNMSPVFLRDMLIEKRYHQKYLLARVVGTPWTRSYTSCIISDPQGSAMILERYDLYHYPLTLRGHRGNVEPDVVDHAKTWREGRYMLVKEPKLSRMYDNEGLFCMVVWSDTDIVWLKDDDPLVTGVDWIDGRRFVNMDDEREKDEKTDDQKSLAQWKDEGNKAYGQKDYLEADRLYSSGISYCANDPDAHLLCMNRSATYMALERYPAALADVETALELVQRKLQVCEMASNDYETTIKWDEKARLRRAKCLYNLREWRKAQDAHVDILERFPGCKEARAGLQRCVQRVEEQTKGSYDYLALFLQDREKNQHRLDVADYIGPVEITHTAEHGRALKTTRAVKTGELLLANKAIAAVFPSDWQGGMARINNNLLRFVEDSPCASRLPSELTYKWIHQPQIRTMLDRLPRGPGVKQAKVFPIVEMYNRKAQDEKDKPLDPNIIERVATFAAATYDSINYQGTGVNLINPLSIGDPCDVFPYSSFIPHACLGNATSRFIGDVHFIRAAEDMPPNTIITINRVHDQQFNRRPRLLLNMFGEDYHCRCALCKDEEKDGEKKSARRRELNSNFTMEAATQSIGTGGTLEKTRKDVQKCKNIVELIRRTFSSERTSLVEYEILIPLMSMGYCHTRIGNYTGISTENEAIEAYKELFAASVSSSPKIPKSRQNYLSRISRFIPLSWYSAMGNDLQAKRWAQAMVWADKMVLGPSMPLFREINKAHIEKYDFKIYL